MFLMCDSYRRASSSKDTIDTDFYCQYENTAVIPTTRTQNQEQINCKYQIFSIPGKKKCFWAEENFWETDKT